MSASKEERKEVFVSGWKDGSKPRYAMLRYAMLCYAMLLYVCMYVCMYVCKDAVLFYPTLSYRIRLYATEHAVYAHDHNLPCLLKFSFP
jgi:hypothetical protein